MNPESQEAAARRERSATVRRLALAAGFDVAGVAIPEALEGTPDAARFRRWLERDRHGSMAYMSRFPEKRLDPGKVLAGARSVVAVAMNHGDGGGPQERPAGTGRIARYARGRDYHKVLKRRLAGLEDRIREAFPGAAVRSYVDTGPVLEKLWAERAGLGWRGKHTNLVSREWGSWLLLGEVLIDLELEPDVPGGDFCGTCSRCIETCPTGAIPAPYQLDARLCISYLTIEHRGSIPVELRPLLGDRVFGCDDCLEACPWNRFARRAREAQFRPRPELLAPLLVELVAMDDAVFLARFAGTAVMRAKREGLARNACVALGNVGGPDAVPALERAAASDPSPVVREHAAWALQRLGAGSHRREPESTPRS